MENIDIQSSNIKCGGCVANIEKGLKNLAGITAISVDIASNRIRVEGENLDRSAIESRLAELGYPPF